MKLSGHPAIGYGRALVAGTLVFIVFGVFLNVAVLSHQRGVLLQAARTHAAQELSLVASLVEEPLLRRDYAEVEYFLREWARRRPTVAELTARAPNGFELVRYRAGVAPPRFFLTLAQPVRVGGRQLLHLERVEDLSPVNANLRQISTRLGVGSALFASLLGLTLWLTLRALALRPLESEISRRRAIEGELRQTQQQLEDRVEVRTAELSHANTNLRGEVRERQRAERSLEEQRNLLDRVLRQVPSLVFWKDADGRYLGCNERFAEVFGGGSENGLIGVCDAELDLPPPVLQAFTEDDRMVLSGDGVPAPREVALPGADGERVIFWCLRTPLFDAAGKVAAVLGVLTDVSARKQAEEERLRMEAQLQHAQRLESLGVLAGGIAHDFNNLLMGILGNSELATAQLPPEHPSRTCLRRVETTAERAADLVQQMLAYSGEGVLQAQPLDLSATVRETIELLEVAVAKTAQLQVELDTSLPPILADAAQLHQVVMNLITNASDALGDTAGTVALATGVRLVAAAELAAAHAAPDAAAGEYVCLQVADNGQGMDAATLARIFDPFFTTKFLGRGLGLAATLGIVRSHGGAIRVTSTPGRGTTVQVLFPARTDLRLEPRVGTVVKMPPVLHRSGERRRGTVLLVDDEAAARQVLTTALKDDGFAVLEAVDGVQGVELFRRHQDHIVVTVLDLSMPRMGGDEAYRRIRRLHAGAPVILVSGYGREEAMERFAVKDSAVFLKKPFRPRLLLDTIDHLLAGGGGDAGARSARSRGGGVAGDAGEAGDHQVDAT